MKLPFEHVGRVIKLLDPKERQKLLFVTLGAIFIAMIEVIGVGSIMPFMSVAAKPEIIHGNRYLRGIYNFFGFKTDMSFLIFLGITVLIFLILTNITQAIMHYAKVKFTSMRRHTLAHRLLQKYLAQDYSFFLNRNSYEFVKNVNIEIQNMILSSLILFVELISRFIQVSLLTVFLFIVNPLSTLGISGVILIIYGTIYVAVRGKLKKLGTERFDLIEQLSRIVSEAFWGIKEVKITGTESIFSNEFISPSKKLARNDTTNEVISDIPKFALETAAFSSIMFFVLITILRSGTFADVAGTVTLYAYAGYRMIPAVQGLFRSITRLKYGAPTAEKILKEFSIITDLNHNYIQTSVRLPFSKSLEIKNLTFTYPNIENPVIQDLNLTIPVNSLLGFAGKTGSGKTTLIDIILGLLKPDSGKILADGMLLSESNIRSWQANLGYVPQNIYLSNDTISANIAFGVPREKIDFEAVEKAARMAQIHEFICLELKNNYQTMIGERGIRLSGGQRQRLGIARALYRDPSFLVMDEATSALDSQTESAVMEAIDRLQGTRTILIIAHRLSTLRKCDKIFLMEKGNIMSSGTYQEMGNSHADYFNRI